MREVEFKAWDRVNKKWVEMTDKITVFGEEGFIWDFIISFSAYNSLVLSADDFGFNVVQYTGLKDKNGKKIFEGDIIKTDYANGYMKDEVFVCEWDSEFGCWQFNGRYDNKFGDWVDCSLGGGSYPEMIVAGNIYENPELLNV